MSMQQRKSYKLSDLIKGIDVKLIGNPDCEINGVSVIYKAKPGHLTFLSNPFYRKFLNDTEASAIILDEQDAKHCSKNLLIASNPYFAYAQIAKFFKDKEDKNIGIHPTVIIGEGSQIHPSASINAYTVIGKNVLIDAEVVIGPNCFIGEGVSIQKNTHIDSNVTLYRRVSIGERGHISSGVVIGSDGFGFANEKKIWHKVPQLGCVIIGNDVDIGANTCIDCGAIENTVIEDGVILDNLIQIGHNVRIGKNTAIAGCVAIAGSTTIGQFCMIGGGSRITGHINICDEVIITGMTGVEKSIQEPGIYSSGVIGAVRRDEFTKNNARFYRLENLMKRVKQLEMAIKKLEAVHD